MNKVTYEEYLEQNHELTYTNVGVSMLPMMKQGRDLFTVKKKQKEDVKNTMLCFTVVLQVIMFFTE